MYCSASIEISAPCRFSRIRTRGLPPAMRVSVAREELEDLDPVLGLLLLGRHGGRASLAADGRAQLADLRELREEGDQVGREIGEVGALGGGAARVAGAEVVLDELAEALVGKGAVLLDEAAVEDADLARDRARFFSSSSRRVLPMPGSPATTANWQSPAIAAFKRRWSSANSFSRPMNAESGRARDRRGWRLRTTRHAELVGRQARLGGGAARRRPGPPRCGRLRRVLLEAAQDDVLELLPDLGARARAAAEGSRGRCGRGSTGPRR